MTYRELCIEAWARELNISTAAARLALESWERRTPPPANLDQEVLDELAEWFTVTFARIARANMN